MKHSRFIIGGILLALLIDGVTYATTRESGSEAMLYQEPETEESTEPTEEEIAVSISAGGQAESIAEEPTEEEIRQPEGILCIGDEFLRREEAEQYAYPVVIQKALAEQGMEVPVENKGLGGCGSLSIMRYAGVSMDRIQVYLDAHENRQSSISTSQRMYETQVKEFANGGLDAASYENYIPVIFMGYYGGWNGDVNELIQQQNDLLDALHSQYRDQSIIIGLAAGDNRAERQEYEDAMVQAWGERYISVKQEIRNPAASAAGQEEIGNLAAGRIITLLENENP